MSSSKNKKVSLLGKFLLMLRETKCVTTADVEKATGIKRVYLTLLETGHRAKLPSPDRLRKLADYYNVDVSEFLKKAGYLDQSDSPKDKKETEEERIEREFRHVLNQPKFSYGTRLKKELDLETKKFIVDMYKNLTGDKDIDKSGTKETKK